ncbi:MAG: C1 family peptidase [Prevotellaceae bacterium]|jgi:bleomycin hydrolase|nr:C1 family peptidase [Prevotellaceae bacterium]
MKHQFSQKFIAAICCIFSILSIVSCKHDTTDNKQKKQELPSVYVFSNEKILPVTSVKNQSKSGTCWSFATISFLESELLREGKGEYDLSEMFPVYYSYLSKAVKKVRRHGNSAASQGGQAHDVMNVIRDYGIVPESVYSGIPKGDSIHNHSKLSNDLKEYLQAILQEKTIPENMLDGYRQYLDAHLGIPPQTFEYNGQRYTPAEFAKSLIDVDNYVELTSYLCYPFYKKIILEIPDNWSNDLYYNLPIDEFMSVIDNALENGYTVVWDGDVSEKGFSHKNCVAIAPVETVENLFSEMREEYSVDDDLRQKTFDSYETTDDHLMHLVGTSTDANNKKYYVIKNSWGTNRNSCDGFLNMSEAFVRLKTVAIMVNKKAIPENIAEKLGIKTQ